MQPKKLESKTWLIILWFCLNKFLMIINSKYKNKAIQMKSWITKGTKQAFVSRLAKLMMEMMLDPKSLRSIWFPTTSTQSSQWKNRFNKLNKRLRNLISTFLIRVWDWVRRRWSICKEFLRRLMSAFYRTFKFKNKMHLDFMIGFLPSILRTLICQDQLNGRDRLHQT